MDMKLRVGIIGASTSRGWARLSHIPALQQSTAMRLYAVGSSSQAGADTARQAFGAEKAYASVDQLLSDPLVDVIVIAVRVPSHRELVLAALKAGKHVYCEWPLGRDLAESVELEQAASASGLHVAVGLQARMAPALRRARELIDADAIGRVLAARLLSTTVAFGKTTGDADLYLEDPANGATHLTIHGGHAIDAAIAILGPLSDVNALTTIQFPHVHVGPAGHLHRRVVPDDIMMQSRLAAGGALAVEVAGGKTGATPFRLEIDGERGSILLAGSAARGFQSGVLTLSLNGEAVPLQPEPSGLPSEAVNIAHFYNAFASDIGNGTRTVADFSHAVRLTRLLQDVALAAENGARRGANLWPVA